MGDATSGWTTSARWERRSLSEAKALHKHEARDRGNPGHGHRNPDIEVARTGDNQVWVADDEGLLVPSTHPGDWARAIDRNLARVKGARWDEAEQQWYDAITKKDGSVGERKRRSDRTEVIDVVFQLDPEFTGPIEGKDDQGNPVPMTPEMRQESARLLMVMYETMAEKVGRHNVVGFAIHWDETHPHAHMQLTPIDEKGKLDWKSFINGPQATSAFHDRFRLDLRAAGYQATMERVSDGKKHLGVDGFKKKQDHERAVRQELADLRVELDVMGTQLTAREQELGRVRAEVEEWKRYGQDVLDDVAAMKKSAQADRDDAQELRRTARREGHREGLEDGRRAAKEEEAKAAAEAEQRRTQVEREYQAVQRARSAAEKVLADLIAAQEELEKTPKSFERFLDRPRGDGKTLRQLYDHETAVARRRRAELVAEMDAELAPPLDEDFDY